MQSNGWLGIFILHLLLISIHILCITAPCSQPQPKPVLVWTQKTVSHLACQSETQYIFQGGYILLFNLNELNSILLEHLRQTVEWIFCTQISITFSLEYLKIYFAIQICLSSSTM
jgi:hypothetical protein